MEPDEQAGSAVSSCKGAVDTVGYFSSKGREKEEPVPLPLMDNNILAKGPPLVRVSDTIKLPAYQPGRDDIRAPKKRTSSQILGEHLGTT